MQSKLLLRPKRNGDYYRQTEPSYMDTDTDTDTSSTPRASRVDRGRRIDRERDHRWKERERNRVRAKSEGGVTKKKVDGRERGERMSIRPRLLVRRRRSPLVPPERLLGCRR